MVKVIVLSFSLPTSRSSDRNVTLFDTMWVRIKKIVINKTSSIYKNIYQFISEIIITK